MKRDSQSVSEPCGLTFARLCRLTDDEVMAHIQAGHDDALTVLFDRYYRLVVSVAYRILRDLGEAEDVTQAVFLEIYQASARFDPARGSAKAWLMQYAYHRSMNRRLYLKRRKFYDQEPTASADSGVTENPQPVNGGGLLALQEVRSLVREALESLNGPQRRTLQLVYFEGLSLREVAAKTGDSFGNVRHHYYRGLSHLRSFVLRRSSDGSAKTTAEIIHRGTVDAEA